MVSAIVRSVPAKADLRRHPSTIVRNGSGREKRRMESCERPASVETAMLGSSVMPAPVETICARVGRLVARNPSSSSIALEQYSKT